jgi:hypothetical protein
LLLGFCYYSSHAILGRGFRNGNYLIDFYSWFGGGPQSGHVGSWRLLFSLQFFISNSPWGYFAIVIGFFALPVFATFFALRVKNLLLAAAYTWLALLLAPLAGEVVFVQLASLAQAGPNLMLMYAGIATGNAAGVWLVVRALHGRLARRAYAF